MNVVNATILLAFALGMSAGQVLFKMAADQAKQNTTSGLLWSLFSNGYFILAVVVYGAMTLLWVWILMRVPLSLAYPFVALAFVFTPAFAILFFGETVSVWYFVGLALILTGLSVLVLKAH